jgi:hypothetical protein
MKTYLVRDYETKTVHGVFWAGCTSDLWSAVDEMADPYFFEYAPLRIPSGLWHEKMIGEPKPPEKVDWETGEGVSELEDYYNSLRFTASGDYMPWDAESMMDQGLRWKRFQDGASFWAKYRSEQSRRIGL